MGKAKISLIELEKLLGQGLGVRAIADKLRVSPSAVSQALKKRKVAVSRNAVVRRAGELVDKRLALIDELNDCNRRIKNQLNGLEANLKALENSKDDEAKLKYFSEIRAHNAELRHQIEFAWSMMRDLGSVKDVLEAVEIIKGVIREYAPADVRQKIAIELARRGNLAGSSGWSGL